MDYRKQIKTEFENANNNRAWFKEECREDFDLEEGFIYEDFTTDMCWTCWFQAWKKYSNNPLTYW